MEWDRKTAITNILCQCSPVEAVKSWLNFWKKVPRRVWNFYINTFLVPSYRKEWGKYRDWSYREPVRPKRSTRRKRRKSEVKPAFLADDLPVPVKHDHTFCTVVHINVSGAVFSTQLRTLNQFPNTLLGDPDRRAQFFDSSKGEYFFDRSRTCFEAIMYYYQTGGVLRRPFNSPSEMFLEEIEFFDLGRLTVDRFKQDEGLLMEEDKPLPKNLLQRKYWLLFEYPESSLQARILAIISVMVIIISIFVFCVETMEPFRKPNVHLINNDLEGTSSNKTHIREPTISLRNPLYFVEATCIAWFIYEYLGRAVMCPSKWNFFKDVTNFIDLISIIPFFISIIVANENPIRGGSKSSGNRAMSLAVLRVIRLVRVFRILKLSRHNRGLKILGKTLKASIRELGLLVFFLILCLILFSSAVYFAEATQPAGSINRFTSIPESFWWAVITMTTVGYGDLCPVTVWGKLVGSLCAIAGVLTLALPVPVIVSNFNTFYHRDEVKDNDGVSFEHVTHCPYLPASYSSSGYVTSSFPVTEEVDNLELDEDEHNEYFDYFLKAYLASKQHNLPESDSEFEDLKYNETNNAPNKLSGHRKKIDLSK